MGNDDVIASLRTAVAAAPDDHALRLHLAQLLLDSAHSDSARSDEAVQHVATVLAAEPTSPEALALMRTLTAPAPASPEGNEGFDWRRAEEQFSDLVPPSPEWDVEHAGVRLDDVGGMTQAKEQVDTAFLAPLRNPGLQRLYGASALGGLLLYGPPGCGKTYLARAVAGELGAKFIHASLADALDALHGAASSGEPTVHDLFDQVRRHRPCLLFLDELDAMGRRRSHARTTAMRTLIDHLVIELDALSTDGEGVYVLAATNQPWDVDPALLQPGRFERRCYVGPPDRDARQALLEYHLRRRPVGRIDLQRLARLTDAFSGADLAYLCDSAARRTQVESSRTGAVRMIGMGDFDAVLAEISPSTDAWFDVAANVVAYANQSGQYDELARDLRRRRR